MGEAARQLVERLDLVVAQNHVRPCGRRVGERARECLAGRDRGITFGRGGQSVGHLVRPQGRRGYQGPWSGEWGREPLGVVLGPAWLPLSEDDGQRGQARPDGTVSPGTDRFTSCRPTEAIAFHPRMATDPNTVTEHRPPGGRAWARPAALVVACLIIGFVGGWVLRGDDGPTTVLEASTPAAERRIRLRRGGDHGAEHDDRTGGRDHRGRASRRPAGPLRGEPRRPERHRHGRARGRHRRTGRELRLQGRHRRQRPGRHDRALGRLLPRGPETPPPSASRRTSSSTRCASFPPPARSRRPPPQGARWWSSSDPVSTPAMSGPAIGVRVPQYGSSWEGDPGVRRAAPSGAGFAGLWVNDHLQSPGRMKDEPAFDALVTLSALAALTARPRLGVAVLSASYRPAPLAAKMADDPGRGLRGPPGGGPGRRLGRARAPRLRRPVRAAPRAHRAPCATRWR